jgi:hypothetical protein
MDEWQFRCSIPADSGISSIAATPSINLTDETSGVCTPSAHYRGSVVRWCTREAAGLMSVRDKEVYALLVVWERVREVWGQNENRIGRQSSLARPVRDRARAGLGEEHEHRKKT